MVVIYNFRREAILRGFLKENTMDPRVRRTERIKKRRELTLNARWCLIVIRREAYPAKMRAIFKYYVIREKGSTTARKTDNRQQKSTQRAQSHSVDNKCVRQW